MTHELKPCPFCGEKNQLKVTHDTTLCIGHGDYVKVSYVVCNECYSTGPQFDDWDFPNDDRKTLAVNAWNTRWQPEEEY